MRRRPSCWVRQFAFQEPFAKELKSSISVMVSSFASYADSSPVSGIQEAQIEAWDGDPHLL